MFALISDIVRVIFLFLFTQDGKMLGVHFTKSDFSFSIMISIFFLSVFSMFVNSGCPFKRVLFHKSFLSYDVRCDLLIFRINGFFPFLSNLFV